MPVHDLGYRGWTGARMSHLMRPLVVARGGISLVWRRRWLRMMIIFSWLPILLFGVGIFMFEYSATEPGWGQVLGNLLAFQLQRPDLALSISADHAGSRHDVWATLILTFFRVPQLFAMVLLVGLIAPMLISYDLRSKAYLMYFSRPLSPTQYIIGKSAVLWFFLSTITAIPALILYLVGVFLSPDLSVIGETWDIPFRILGATVVLVVPTTALALCYSSFTSESRYATFSWFATWAMGFIAYSVLTYSGARMRGGPPQRPRGPRGRGRPRFEDFDAAQYENMASNMPPGLADIDRDKWRLLSPYETLGKVEGWVFGIDPTPGSVWPSIIMLIAITVGGLWIVRHRIMARLSV
ncbi:ABC transporter permease subunit [Planctomycetes bacterium K23_9]|uniref:ABC-2 family transporter protein n=1 Tax=Stieleria marina TaxID=1930275 RepID=A0A517NNH6_9BACT|nr:ABC-2 family transporter protein [Planctomycetes bacterium K23_9]